MLHFVLGRNYCNKTEYVRELVADRVNAGETGLIIIVPKQFSYDTEKGMLEKVGAAGMQRLEVLSLSRLAELVLEKTGRKSDKQSVDNGVKMLTMSMALEELSDRLEIFRRYSSKPALTQSIVALATELKQCSVGVEELEAFAASLSESSLKNKLNELTLVISAYNAMLEKSYYDTDSSLTLLCETLDEYKYFEGKTVVIDAFTHFTKQETGVIEKIVSQSEETYITFTTDPEYDGDDYPQFDNVNIQISKIKRVAEKNGVEIADSVIINDADERLSSELKELERNIFSPLRKQDDTHIPENIRIYGADNKSDECNYIALTVKKLIRENKARCRDIIVYQREKGSYDSELVSAFRRYGVPFFEDRRQPVEGQPLIVYVSSLLEIICNGFSTQMLMRYLKTGLTSLTDDEICELENYAFLWNINSDKWKNAFTDNPYGLGKKIGKSAQKELDALNLYREKAVAPILEFREAFTAAQGEEKAKVLFEFLENNATAQKLREISQSFADTENLVLFEEQDAVWSMLMGMLDRLYLALEGSKVSNKRFLELFYIILSVSDLGTLPQGLDNVMLALADRTRAGLKKYVFIVGANDGVFPKTPSSEGLLNDIDRQKLKDAGIELAETAQFKGIEEQYIAYGAMCCATDGLFVTYSRSDYKGTALTESEIVSQIKAVFPLTETLGSESIRPIDRIESGASAFDEYAREFTSDTALKSSLAEYFSGDTVYSGRIATLKNASEKREKKLTNPETARKLFGGDMQLSFSKIDCYKGCAFRYFCQYGLGAEARKEAKIDSLLKGTIIHYVFETLMSKYSKQQLEEIDDSLLEKEISDALGHYLEEFMGGAESKTKRFLAAYKMIGKDLLIVFRRICEEFRTCSFEPEYFELGIGEKDDDVISPYKLTLDDGSVIKINGKIDRVDVMKTNSKQYVRIIDYKSKGKAFSLGEVLNGFNMQMLIYLFALYVNGKDKLGEFIPSGILYMPSNTAAPNLGRNAGEEEIMKKRLLENRMTGIVLDDMTVLEGMEKDLNGYFIPVSMKDGKPEGSIISLKALLKLKDELDKTIRKIGSDIHEGIIHAVPANDACTYCDFKSVCGFEDGDPVLEMTVMSDEEAIQMLEADGEGEDNG